MPDIKVHSPGDDRATENKLSAQKRGAQYDSLHAKYNNNTDNLIVKCSASQSLSKVRHEVPANSRREQGSHDQILASDWSEYETENAPEQIECGDSGSEVRNSKGKSASRVPPISTSAGVFNANQQTTLKKFFKISNGDQVTKIQTLSFKEPRGHQDPSPKREIKKPFKPRGKDYSESSKAQPIRGIKTKTIKKENGGKVSRKLIQTLLGFNSSNTESPYKELEEGRPASLSEVQSTSAV